MVEGQEPIEAAASKLWPEKRQSRIIQSIFSLELRISDAAKLETREAGGAAALRNGNEHRVSKESCGGENRRQRSGKAIKTKFNLKNGINLKIPFSGGTVHSVPTNSLVLVLCLFHSCFAFWHCYLKSPLLLDSVSFVSNGFFVMDGGDCRTTAFKYFTSCMQALLSLFSSRFLPIIMSGPTKNEEAF